MSNKKYALEMIDCLYEDGDIDLIFLSQLIGIVSYNADDRPFNKSHQKRISDALVLLKYLISGGDFVLGETICLSNGKCEYRAYEGDLNSISESLGRLFDVTGIDDIELKTRFWVKKVRAMSRKNNLPDEIGRLFCS